jgi:hypothetical protein
MSLVSAPGAIEVSVHGRRMCVQRGFRLEEEEEEEERMLANKNTGVVAVVVHLQWVSVTSERLRRADKLTD